MSPRRTRSSYTTDISSQKLGQNGGYSKNTWCTCRYCGDHSEALKYATWAEHPHPDGVSMVRSLIGAYRLDGSIPIATRKPPTLGEHRDEVSKDWIDKD